MSLRFLTILFCLFVFIACSASKRKISDVGVRDPNSVTNTNYDEMRNIPPIRMQAQLLQDVKSCPSGLARNVKRFALKKLQRTSCPKNFFRHMSDLALKGILSSDAKAVLESLKNSQCKAVVNSDIDQRDKISVSINQKFLSENSKAQHRATAKNSESLRAIQLLEQDLALIQKFNSRMDRRLASKEEKYLLTDGQLNTIMSLMSRKCKISSNEWNIYFSTLNAMEETKELILDPDLRQAWLRFQNQFSYIIDTESKKFF